MTAGERRFLVERVDLTQDCTVVSWRPLDEPAPAEPPPDGPEAAIPLGEATLLADGRVLEVLPLEAAGQSGARPPAAGNARTVGYPVPRRCRSLAVVIAAPSGQRSQPLALKLP